MYISAICSRCLLVAGIVALIGLEAAGYDVTLDKCYTVDDRNECFTYPLNWHTSFTWAQQFCSNRQANLVSIKSKQMQDAVEDFAALAKFHNDILTGALLQAASGWLWTNQIALRSTFKVLNQSATEDYRVNAGIFVDGEEIQIIARHPVDALPYICQYELGLRYKYCKQTTQTFEHGGLCYVAYTDHFKGWYSARKHCLKNGGDLAVFNDVHDIVTTKLMTKAPYWVGLRTHWWRWLDATEMKFSNWAPGEPSGRTNQCVVMSADNAWQWKTVDCGQKSPVFVCELYPVTLGMGKLSPLIIIIGIFATILCWIQRHRIARYCSTSSFLSILRRRVRSSLNV